MSNRRNLIIAILAIVGLCCVGGVVVVALGNLVGERDAEFMDQLELVCDGTGAGEAAAYVAGTGLHPTAAVRIGSGGAFNASDELPESWLPDGLGEAQLVVCMERTTDLVETCEYDLLDDAGNETGEEASVQRYQYHYAVRLLEAQSAQLVGETNLAGTAPDDCGDEVQFIEGVNAQLIYGQEPATTAVVEWLRPYVEQP